MSVVRISVATFAVVCRLSAFYAPESQDRLNAAITLIKAGAYADSEVLLDKLLAEPDAAPRTLYWKGYVQFSTRRYSESAATLRLHIERNGTDAQARKLLGLDLFMIGDIASAQAELEQAVALLPKDEEARYYLGRVYFTRQNMPAALATFQQVLEFEPRSVRARNQLGQTFEGLNQFESAEKAYEEAIRIDRESPRRSEWPHYNLGVLQLKAGKAELALPHFTEALQIQPRFTQARVQRGIALAALGKISEARVELEGVIADEPNNPDAHYQLGRVYRKLGDQAKAKEHLLRFQELQTQGPRTQ